MLTTPAFILAVAGNGENTPLNLGSGSTAHTAHAASGGGIVRTIVALLVVVAVIYAITWVLKKVKSTKEATVSGTSLESLATLPLGTNRALHLVRAGSEVVLLGSAEQGVTPIRRFSEAEALQLGLLDGTTGATLDVLPDLPAATPRSQPQTIGGLLEALRRKTVIK
jgi:flagellar protein FliO/FliZ